jgi:hypothetical protein
MVTRILVVTMSVGDKKPYQSGMVRPLERFVEKGLSCQVWNISDKCYCVQRRRIYVICERSTVHPYWKMPVESCLWIHVHQMRTPVHFIAPLVSHQVCWCASVLERRQSVLIHSAAVCSGVLFRIKQRTLVALSAIGRTFWLVTFNSYS